MLKKSAHNTWYCAAGFKTYLPVPLNLIKMLKDKLQ